MRAWLTKRVNQQALEYEGAATEQENWQTLKYEGMADQ
jgi:hypothetical protein